MATLDNLCQSITEIPFEDAMKRVMACRLARRQALTLEFEKRKEKAEKKAATASQKAGRAKKPPSLQALTAALTPEQRQQLIAELTGGNK